MTVSHGYKAVVVALLFVYAALAIWRPLDTCIDVWAHAAVGKWVWEQQAFPRTTLFLWTESIPWVYHSWLSQLMFFAVASTSFSSTALLSFTVLVGLAPLALVVWAWTGRESSWIVLPGVWMIDGIIGRVQPRPDLFTSLGLTILLLLLSRFPGRASRWWVAGFVALFALWANLHGAVIVGLLMLAATVVCDAVQDRDWGRTRALGLLFLVALAAVQLNPYGIGYWRAFLSVNTYTFSMLSEWNAVWESPPLHWDIGFGAAVAAATACVAWALSPQRRLAQLAWLVLATAMFLTARRNVSVLILVGAVVTAVNARAIDGQRLWEVLTSGRRTGAPLSIPSTLRWVFRGAILCSLALELAALAYPPPKTEPLPKLQNGAVAFLHRYRPQGRVFTDMENSSYFLWQFGRNMPLFIDGLNAYPDQLMRDYLTIVRGDKAAHALIDSYDINVIILTVYRYGSLEHLAANLDRDRDWARVYAGPDAVIWVRRRDFAALVQEVGPVNPVSFANLEHWR